MSMVDPIKGPVEKDIEIRNQTGEVIQIKKQSVTRLLYKCRPQVNERKKNWVKFGDVANVPRGQHRAGELVIPQTPTYIQDDEGHGEQEIDITKKLIAMSKEMKMSKALGSK